MMQNSFSLLATMPMPMPAEKGVPVNGLSRPCRFWTNLGHCEKGSSCTFIHAGTRDGPGRVRDGARGVGRGGGGRGGGRGDSRGRGGYDGGSNGNRGGNGVGNQGGMNRAASSARVDQANFDIVLTADGCCLGNPGPGGYGFVLKFPSLMEIFEGHGYVGAYTTSNYTEWCGLYEGLKHAVTKIRSSAADGRLDVLLRSDSELILNQVTGKYAVKNARLLRVHAMVQSLVAQFKLELTTEWVRGHAGDEDNERADELAKEATSSGNFRRKFWKAKEKGQRDGGGEKKATQGKHKQQQRRQQQQHQQQSRHRGGQDFTADWLHALSLHMGDRAYHEALLAELLACYDEQGNAVSGVPTSRPSTQPAQHQNHHQNHSMSRIPPQIPFLQTRYLILYCLVNIIEDLVHEARGLSQHRQWVECGNAWESAFGLVNSILRLSMPRLLSVNKDVITVPIDMSQWAAVVADAEDSGQFADVHDAGLHQVWTDTFMMLCQDNMSSIEQQRDRHIRDLEKELNKILRKLTPMLNDRDAVREKMGTERWKSNPAPKMDFAEQRKAYEEERTVLEAAIERIGEFFVELVDDE